MSNFFVSRARALFGDEVTGKMRQSLSMLDQAAEKGNIGGYARFCGSSLATVMKFEVGSELFGQVVSSAQAAIAADEDKAAEVAAILEDLGTPRCPRAAAQQKAGVTIICALN